MKHQKNRKHDKSHKGRRTLLSSADIARYVDGTPSPPKTTETYTSIEELVADTHRRKNPKI